MIPIPVSSLTDTDDTVPKLSPEAEMAIANSLRDIARAQADAMASAQNYVVFGHMHARINAETPPLSPMWTEQGGSVARMPRWTGTSAAADPQA